MSKINQKAQSQTVNVSGMHCTSCANIIRKQLEKVAGVEKVAVHYATETADIRFHPQQTSLAALNTELKKFGYQLQTNNRQSRETASQQENALSQVNSASQHSLHASHEMSLLNKDSENKKRKLEELRQMRKQLRVLLTFAALSISMMFWETGIRLQIFPNIPEILQNFFHYLMPIMATYTLFVAGQQYIQAIGRFFRYKVANMDTLVGIGTVVAFVYSFLISAFGKAFSAFIDTSILYYDVTIVVIAFITFGKYLEAASKLKTGEAIEKLLNLQAKTAVVLRAGKEQKIPIEEVIVGDILLVKPGQKIPTDAVILSGNSAIDESMITGEAFPVDKKVADSVIGGTLNKQGFLQLRATKVGQETVLAQIISFVEKAQNSPAPIEKLADQISAIFVPVVLFLAVAVFVAWLGIGSQFYPFSQAFSMALLSFVGILVIACPCAMGLATPMAVIVGVGKAAQNGILIKDAESLEKFQKISLVVFDKTGTLTQGKAKLQDWQTLSDLNEEKGLQLLASLEKHSEHPLGEAILRAAEKQGISLLSVKNFKALTGRGIKGNIAGKEYFAGNKTLAKELQLSIDEQILQNFSKQGKTAILLMTRKHIIAVGSLSDSVKTEAKSVIEKLHRHNIQVAMLTGDNQKTAEAIASQIGIDRVFAEVLPVNKAEIIQQLQQEGHRVAMLGDGINDAPALAVADIGIAMGTGTDIAIESAGITLLSGNLNKLPMTVKIAQATLRTIHENLFWAFFYNILSIPVAAGILYPSFGIVLNPAIAGIAMAFSSVTVVINALKLKTVQLTEE